VLRLLDAPNTRTYIGLRDRAIILVLVDCGCRIGELTSLKISDVDFRMRQITFRAENTKTNTTRIVPISKRTAKELERLTEFMNVKPDDYLWLTNSVSGISRIHSVRC
jgi:integrase/recombinase XerD